MNAPSEFGDGPADPSVEDVYLTMPPVFVETEIVSPPKMTVYSAPRRFDLATIMSVTVAYAILFAGLRALQAPTITFALIAGFITAVGLAQALLFGGKHPRLSSLLAGSIFLLLLTAYFYIRYGQMALFLAPLIVIGPLLGYLAGAIIGGVFLISAGVRSQLAPTPRDSQEQEQ